MNKSEAKVQFERTPLSNNCLNYGYSFVLCYGKSNSTRFQIESRMRLTDRDGKSTEFYQCASCKSENTFAEKNLFVNPNYDFLPVLSMEELIIFRRHLYITNANNMAYLNYKQVCPVSEPWGKPAFNLETAKNLVVLDSMEKVIQATRECLLLVGQTEIYNETTGLRVFIEYPVKTMNISEEIPLYQVDTGPVLLPDLSGKHERLSDSIRLAFLAYNTCSTADFVVEEPTPVVRGDKEICRVYHYSGIYSFKATNVLLALKDSNRTERERIV